MTEYTNGIKINAYEATTDRNSPGFLETQAESIACRAWHSPALPDLHQPGRFFEIGATTGCDAQSFRPHGHADVVAAHADAASYLATLRSLASNFYVPAIAHLSFR
jgi:hypothetical protein